MLLINLESKPAWDTTKRLSVEENADAPMINKDFIVSIHRHVVPPRVLIMSSCFEPGLNVLCTHASDTKSGSELLTVTADLLKIPIPKHSDPWNFPIWASNLEVMLLTYLVEAGCDPFANDVLLYSEILTAARVPNEANVYEVQSSLCSTYNDQTKYDLRACRMAFIASTCCQKPGRRCRILQKD